MKHLGDITKINGASVPPVNVVIGGSPCQDLSVAGRRKGLKGERSGLFMEQIRIIKEMREKSAQSGSTDIKPRYMVWENVPGAFSSNRGQDFKAVLEETIGIVKEDKPDIPVPKNGWHYSGIIMGDGFSVAWRVFDAQFWGVPQRRRRIALVADFGGTTAPEILFERKGVSGNITQSGTPWEKFTRIVAQRFNSADRAERVNDFDTVPLNTMVCTRQAAETKTCLGVGKPNDPQFTISTEHQHAVAYSFDSLSSNSMKSNNPNSGCRKVDIAKTVDTTIPNPSKNQGGICILNDQGGSVMGVQQNVDKSPTLRAETHGHVPTVYDARGNGEGKIVPTITGDHQNRVTDYTALCVRERCGCEGGGKGCLIQNERSGTLAVNNDQFVCSLDRASFNQGVNAQYDPKISEDGVNSTLTAKGPSAVCAAVDCRNATENNKINGTLQAKSNGGISINMQNVVRTKKIVRRLTPLECERLQGFPDGWTDIGEYIDTNGKKRKTSDSARYKALGNSIALPPWAWVLERISKHCGDNKTMASLFDGIGGFPLIWETLNGEETCIWASEIEEFPIAVTKYHFKED